MCKVKEEFFGGGFSKSFTTSEAPSKPQRLSCNLGGSDKNAGLELTSEAHMKYLRLRSTMEPFTFHLKL